MEPIQKSEQINELATALAKFQAECPNIGLDREVKVRMKTGGEYSFTYATAGNIKSVITPLLAKNGLSYSQLVGIDGAVNTLLLHSSGQWLASSLLIKSDTPTAQGIGSAITYAKRYALSAILGIVTDDDDDGNMATGNEYTTHDKVENNKPWLNEGTKEYDGALKKLKAGTTTIVKIKEVMRLSKKIEEKLMQEMKSVPATN